MMTKFQLVLCLSITLYSRISTSKPLSPEDVEGLLPPTPRDKNETIAAVVQDPVVQDAVQHAASNGSLNGLVVKKNVFIMPASNPYTVLSKRENILVVPTENLEDVRKNITETKQTEATEASSPETLFESEVGEYTPQDIKSEPERNDIDLLSFPEPSPSISTNEKRKSETEFLKDTISHDDVPLSEDRSNKVAVPIVAVIDSSNADKGKVNSPIVAILPSQSNNDVLKNQIQLLNDNSDVIQRKAQNYVDDSSLTIVPDYRKSSILLKLIPDSFSTQEAVPMMVPSWSNQQEQQDALLNPVATSRWEMMVPEFQDYSREKDHDTTIIKDEEDV